jgi:hypothetical protein
MSFILRQINPHAQITDQAMLEAVESAIPQATVKAIVQERGLARQRRRKLSAEMGLLLVVAMNLFTHSSLAQVLMKLLKGFRYVWPNDHLIPASKGAISHLRYELGAAPVVDLFHRVCRPMATEQTPGAFLFGLRLMAMDGTQEMIPDTPENERAFGRHTTERGQAGYPQVLGVYLIEAGTHAIVDAGFWPCQCHEHPGGLRLLRSVGQGMLLMWDCAYHSFDMAVGTRKRDAHFLGRVPSRCVLKPLNRLADGSYWAYLYPSDRQRRQRGEHLLVRVIEYTVTDPALPGYQKRHRLITSLLDATLYPALDLARAYHERWEIEISIDEMDTHQRLAFHPLRSQKPVGVLQELYGLLLAHYAIRKVMFDAAQLAPVDPDRISFINSLYLICDAISEFQQTCPDQHPALYQRLLKDILRFVLPERKTRVNPRVVKRKMSNFNLKRPEHYQWPQPKKSFAEAIAILN